MGLVSYLENLQSVDNFTDTKRIIVSHPTVTHSLLLTEFASDNATYTNNFENFLTTDGRTIKGGLKLVGGTYNPPARVVVSCTITELQLSLFNQLKRVQDNSKVPCTIQDKFKMITYIPSVMSAPTWLSGYPITNEIGQSIGYAAFLVWIDIDQNYAIDRGANTYTLQFTARQSL